MDKIFYEMISNCDSESYKNNNELAIKALSGDIHAKEQLIQQNSKLIHALAKRYKHDNYSEEDLFQDGVIGMIRSLGTYDPGRSSFITHAYSWVLAEIRLNSSNNSSAFHHPVKFKDKVRKYNKLKNELPQSEYLDKELAMYDLSRQDFNNVEKYGQKKCISIDSLTEEGTTASKEDYFLSEADFIENLVINNELKQLFEMEIKKILKPYEAEVLCKAFGINTPKMRLVEIAKEYNVTNQYMSKVKIRALEKLSQHQKLAHFFEG